MPRRTHLVSLFAQMAIHRPVQTPDAEFAAWWEQIAAATPLRLHRPESG